ncbi:hypothetical protein FPZ54_13135 [Sphingomonas suaedae]|uniref:Uncharacterized protein n=1 Tax=Sphingomonas suaedae TaxID=2599297 RepID=A0A518RHB7_9SPHN|nr:hypothetical protein [Sphingomonas suaedae]QDX26857.1 hypothetical protein FPZ54_13135 [Sphingomonas suaedae]
MRTVILILAAATLAACGNRGELKPEAGSSLPPAPYGAVATPKAGELMTPPPQTRPTRSDEVLRSSEERRSDEFELPPQT